MLLKITEKTGPKNYPETGKHPRKLSEEMFFHLHARRTLANVTSDYKYLTPNHTKTFL